MMTEQIDMEQGVPPVEPGYIPQDDGLAGVTNRDSETRQVRDQFAAFVLLKAFLYLVLAFSGLIAISTSFNGVTFSATLLFNGLLTLLATYTANCLIANSLVDVFDPSVLNKVMAHSFLVVMYLLSFIIAWAEKVTTDASMFALFGHFVCLLLLSSIAWILLMAQLLIFRLIYGSSTGMEQFELDQPDIAIQAITIIVAYFYLALLPITQRVADLV